MLCPLSYETGAAVETSPPAIDDQRRVASVDEE